MGKVSARNFPGRANASCARRLAKRCVIVGVEREEIRCPKETVKITEAAKREISLLQSWGWERRVVRKRVASASCSALSVSLPV
jgi:hypothetical protein